MAVVLPAEKVIIDLKNKHYCRPINGTIAQRTFSFPWFGSRAALVLCCISWRNSNRVVLQRSFPTRKIREPRGLFREPPSELPKEPSKQLFSEPSKESSDAVVQTIAPILVNTATQTEEEDFPALPEGFFSYAQYLAGLKAQSLGYKPMYAIPKNQGAEPPLKIGLSLPRGKKRKVFYPDDQEEKEEDWKEKKDEDEEYSSQVIID